MVGAALAWPSDAAWPPRVSRPPARGSGGRTSAGHEAAHHYTGRQNHGDEPTIQEDERQERPHHAVEAKEREPSVLRVDGKEVGVLRLRRSPCHLNRVREEADGWAVTEPAKTIADGRPAAHQQLEISTVKNGTYPSERLPLLPMNAFTIIVVGSSARSG